MRRRLTTFILMFCMCWQALAYAGAGVLVAEGDEIVHAMLHFEGAAHHHDDRDHDHDGGVHQDESPASRQHLMDDACLFAPALLHVVELPLPVLQSGAPAPTAEGSAPRPYLRGLERPPRSRA